MRFKSPTSLRQKLQANAGFSIIELLVTSFIIALISGLVLVSYGGFNSSVLLSNQAYEIALDIRQMQVFSLGERADGGSEREQYGVYFDLGSSRSSYTLYRNNPDGSDDGFDASEDNGFAIGTVDPRFIVTNITADGSSVAELGIIFQRPNYDAIFCARANSGSACDSSVSDIVITVASDADNLLTKEIVVSATGQISVR